MEPTIAQELGLFVVVAVRPIGECHTERSHGATVRSNGHRDERDLVGSSALPGPGAVEKERLSAHLRNHHGSAALHHAASDSLPSSVAGVAAPRSGRADGGLDVQLTGIPVTKDDEAPRRPMGPFEQLEGVHQGRAEIQGRTQGLAEIEEIGQAPDVLFLRDASHSVRLQICCMRFKQQHLCSTRFGRPGSSSSRLDGMSGCFRRIEQSESGLVRSTSVTPETIPPA